MFHQERSTSLPDCSKGNPPERAQVGGIFTNVVLSDTACSISYGHRTASVAAWNRKRGRTSLVSTAALPYRRRRFQYSINHWRGTTDTLNLGGWRLARPTVLALTYISFLESQLLPAQHEWPLNTALSLQYAALLRQSHQPCARVTGPVRAAPKRGSTRSGFRRKHI